MSTRRGACLVLVAVPAGQRAGEMVPRAGEPSARPRVQDHDRGLGAQTSHCVMALRQGWRHSGGGDDESIRTTFIATSLLVKDRRSPSIPQDPEQGAVSQSGAAARNSFSRIPGSWLGIANPTGYEVGEESLAATNWSSLATRNEEQFRCLTTKPPYEGDRIRRCPSDERQMKCTPFAKLSAFSDSGATLHSPISMEFRIRAAVPTNLFRRQNSPFEKRPAFSPLFTAKATFALKAVAWRRRGRLLNHLSASAKLAALRPRFHFTDVPIAQSQS